MATIILDKPYILQPEESTTSVEVICYTDNPVAKQVIATISLNQQGRSIAITLWEGQSYDSIGQWTDAQAQAKIKQILES